MRTLWALYFHEHLNKSLPRAVNAARIGAEIESEEELILRWFEAAPGVPGKTR